MNNWRRTVYVLALTQFVALLAWNFILPFLPLYIQTLGVKRHDAPLWAGMLTASTSIALSICAPFWGVLADRWGRKLMVQRALYTGVVIIFFMGLVSQISQLFLLRLCQGIFTGSVGASQALAAAVTPRDKLTFSMGLTQTAVFTGSSIGPLLGGLVADAFGYRASFIASALFLLVAAVLCTFLVQEDFIPKTKVQRQKDPFTGQLGQLLHNQAFLIMIVVLLLTQFGLLVVAPILPLFVQHLASDQRQVATIAGAVLGVTGISSAISSLFAGRLTKRWGHKAVLVVMTAGAALLYLPHLLVTSNLQLLILRALLGCFLGLILPIASAIIALVTPDDSRGIAYGFTQSASSLGFALGPLTGGLIASTFGLTAVFWITAAILGMVSVWVALAVQSPPLLLRSSSPVFSPTAIELREEDPTGRLGD